MLAIERKKRKVGCKGQKRNVLTLPNTSQHMTVVATIGTLSAPVPPLVLYTSKTTQRRWTANNNPAVKQLADCTNSGYINGFMMLKWLREAFGLATHNQVPPGKC